MKKGGEKEGERGRNRGQKETLKYGGENNKRWDCCAPHYERSQVVNIPVCLNKILLGNEIQCTGCWMSYIPMVTLCMYIFSLICAQEVIEL